MPGERHAGSGPSPAGTLPEPSFAERARTLVHLARAGTLVTQSRRLPGFPFGSVALYAVGESGLPSFLISTMAMHTQNLVTDPRASLLVAQPGWTDDPLAGARVTLVGNAAKVGQEETPAVRDVYLARHENARHWVDYDDFAFYRLEVVEVYWVGGFGEMGWVSAADYGAAAPDPLADAAPAIIAHMNEDHADALALYCRAFAEVAADEATMTAVDRLGFRVRARVGDRLQGLRINFTREARTTAEARAVLVDMVREAREHAGAPAPPQSH
jgi:heme oxygenase (biliverdin-IX-beta and delta-forming)